MRLNRKRLVAREGVRKVLILQLGRLGDVASSRQVVHSLAAAFPGARLEMVVPQPSVELLETEACLATVHAYPVQASARSVARLLGKLRRDPADLVLDVTGSTRARWLAGLCKARRRAGWGRSWLFHHGTPDRRQRDRSYGLEMARLVESLGIPALTRIPALPALPPPETLQAILDPLQGVRPIVLHPGASMPIRRWRGLGFAGLAQRLAAQGHPILWVGGPSETQLVRELADASGLAAPVFLPARVRDLAAALACAKLLIGLDSGPMHVAAALGVPIVALFGPNTPQRAAPLGAQLEVVQIDLECRPCNQVLADCVLPEYNCMDRITVEAVLAQVARILGSV